MLAFGLAALLSAVQSPPPQPKLDAAFIVLVPYGDGFATTEDRLVRETERMLDALEGQGLLRHRVASARREALRDCLDGDSDPSADRRACLRRLLPASESGVPVVAIVIGYTRERGAWQRMECIGPRSQGAQLYFYVDEVDHPRADIRERTRTQALHCVSEALRS